MNTTKNDSGLNLDHLEALARAATPGPWTVRLDGTCSGTWPHINVGHDEYGDPITVAELSTTHTETEAARNSGDMPGSYEDAPGRFELTDQQPLDDANFIAAANPAAVLELIAFARRAAPVSAPIAGDALADDDHFEAMVEDGYTALVEHSNAWRGDPEASPASGRESFAVALRAALANQPAPTAAPEQVAQEADESVLASGDVDHLRRKLIACITSETSLSEQRVWDLSLALVAEAWPILSEPSQAAPLDIGEMTRLRLLMRALGHADAFQRPGEYVRGLLFTVLGQAAGRIKGTLPGSAAAPAPTVPAGDALRKPIPWGAINSILGEVMQIAASNGANSVSMPDEYVAVAHFVAFPEQYAHQPAQEQAEPVAPTLQAFALYDAVNKLMAHIGMFGEINSRHELVDKVMAELHNLDGGKVAQRVEDLVERAFMPRDQATELAVSEYCLIGADASQAAQHEAGAKIDVRHEFEMYKSRLGEAANYIGDGLYGNHGVTDQANAFRAGVEVGFAASPVVRAQSEESAPADADSASEVQARQVETEMADRLRRIVTNHPGGMIQVSAKTLTDAADECDRFYNGMMNWKANAQAKDRTIIDLRTAASAAGAKQAHAGADYRPLANWPTGELDFELQLRRGPRYQCQASDCHSYEDEPGKFDTCPACSRKGYLSGGFKPDPASRQWKEWEKRVDSKFRAAIRAAQKGEQP